MRVSALGDVIKIWVWALGSLVLGLWLTPAAYNGGKALSELSVTKDFNGVINKVAAWSGAAKLEDFFMVCWPVVAAMLLLPLIEWLRLGGLHDGRQGVWRIRLPHGAGVIDAGQALRPNRWGPFQALTGFLATLGCFLLIGHMMLMAGAYAWVNEPGAWREGLVFDIGITLAMAALIEIFFRCAILGVFLRAMKPAAAIALAALMLGWARWRTASVWLPAGLLMGWLLADRLFSKATIPVEASDRLSAYFITGSVQTGLAPLLGVFAVGVFVHLFTHRYALSENAGN